MGQYSSLSDQVELAAGVPSSPPHEAHGGVELSFVLLIAISEL